MDQLKILHDGTYEIDAGAYCGVVPKALWSKYFNDSNNKLRLSLNIPFIDTEKHKFILDSGMGNTFSDNFIKINVNDIHKDENFRFCYFLDR